MLDKSCTFMLPLKPGWYHDSICLTGLLCVLNTWILLYYIKRIVSFSIFEITPTGDFTPILYLCYPLTFTSCICNIALVDSSWISYLRTEMDDGGCSYGGWSGASGEKARWDRGNTVRVKTKTLRVCIFIGRYSYFHHGGKKRRKKKKKSCLLSCSLPNQQSPSVVMTTSTSLLPISSSAVARETKSASPWWQASHKSSRTPVGLGFVAK